MMRHAQSYDVTHVCDVAGNSSDIETVVMDLVDKGRGRVGLIYCMGLLNFLQLPIDAQLCEYLGS